MLKTLSINLAVAFVAFLGLEGLVRMFIPVRNVGPAFTEYDPVYGKRFKQSFSTVRVTPEFRMTFTTNSMRQRGPEPQGSNTGGVLLLGDSFTEGYGVSDGEEYAALVRKELSRRFGSLAPPVWNTGMSNTGNGRSLKILQREGRALAPKAVVLQLMNNDFGDNQHDGLFKVENSALQERSGPAPGQPARFGVHQIVETVPGLASSYAIAALRQARWANDVRGYYTSASGDDLTYRLWERIFAVCRDERWPLVVLAVDLKPERLKRLKTMTAAAQLPLLVPPTPAERPELFFHFDGHWNQRGHEIVSQMVLKAIDATGALDAPKPQSSL